ncbi:MAG: hypothetical protein LBB46_02875, partial [Coriobacteriaceae bacterium]|nr:hypothetical protein [Coriobacteriaceae bacterium]
DFWGHKNYYPDLGTDSVSALMVNSQKGLDVFESVKGGLFHIQVEPGIVFKHNHRAPCGMPQNRTNILNDLIGGKDAIAVFEEALAE